MTSLSGSLPNSEQAETDKPREWNIPQWVPSGNLTWLLEMAIHSEFSHWSLWFSIVMLVYQRVNHGKSFSRHCGKTHCPKRLAFVVIFCRSQPERWVMTWGWCRWHRVNHPWKVTRSDRQTVSTQNGQWIPTAPVIHQSSSSSSTSSSSSSKMTMTRMMMNEWNEIVWPFF